MKTFNRKDKMDEMETLKHDGWDFLCSGEQLPSGSFQAVVRHRASLEAPIQTLALDAGQHFTTVQALALAKELAMEWVRRQDLIGQGEVGGPEEVSERGQD